MRAGNDRIIISTSARFNAPNQVQGIVQFSSANLIEAPSCLVSSQIDWTSFVTIANSEAWPQRTVLGSIEFALDELWKVALDRAAAAADNVRLRVVSSPHFGEGD
jgi:hypothetical protein